MIKYTVMKDSEARIIEKKSEFIANSYYVASVTEVRERLEKIKSAYPDASHHVYAYSLLDGGLQHSSDDGEPQGTAGMPVLKVINFNGLVNTLIIVTRYFGGILLGAGGLVRAYSKAASTAAEISGKTEIVEFCVFRLEYGYDLNKHITRLLDAHGAKIREQTYSDKITLISVLNSDDYAKAKKELNEQFYTKIKLEELNRFLSGKDYVE